MNRATSRLQGLRNRDGDKADIGLSVDDHAMERRLSTIVSIALSSSSNGASGLERLGMIVAMSLR